MAARWKDIDQIHVEQDGHCLVIRSQRERSLIARVGFGLLFIAGVTFITIKNGDPLDSLFSQAAFGILVCGGLLAMMPERLSTTFDVRERRVTRLYVAVLGLLRRTRVFAFDNIVLGIRDHEKEGFWSPVIAQKDEREFTMTIRGSSRDDAINAIETIAGATAIAIDKTGCAPV